MQVNIIYNSNFNKLDYNFIGCTIFIFIFAIGLSVLQFYLLSNKIKIVSIFLNALYILSALLTYLLNPGTYYKLGKKKRVKYCKECNFNYPFHKKLKHCYECGICVIGIDHHCGVFGKCIARNNLFWFYCFITCNFLYVFSCLGTFVYILQKLPI